MDLENKVNEAVVKLHELGKLMQSAIREIGTIKNSLKELSDHDFDDYRSESFPKIPRHYLGYNGKLKQWKVDNDLSFPLITAMLKGRYSRKHVESVFNGREKPSDTFVVDLMKLTRLSFEEITGRKNGKRKK